MAVSFPKLCKWIVVVDFLVGCLQTHSCCSAATTSPSNRQVEIAPFVPCNTEDTFLWNRKYNGSSGTCVSVNTLPTCGFFFRVAIYSMCKLRCWMASISVWHRLASERHGLALPLWSRVAGEIVCSCEVVWTSLLKLEKSLSEISSQPNSCNVHILLPMK